MASPTSGSNLSVFAILDAVRRRKFLLIAPTLVLGIGFSYYAMMQPDLYRATTQVAAQQLTPPEYLRGLSQPPLHIEDHLWTVREVLLSDQVLNEAGHELRAYRNLQGFLPTEALEEIKKNIAIKVDGEHTFTVTFEGDNPLETANVANKLSQLFVSRASSRQEQKTEDTQSIIQQQLDALKERLAQEDKQVRNYKQSAANELPEHVDDNIRAVDTLRGSYRETESKIGDEEAHRTSVVREMKELEGKGALDQPIVTEKSPAEVHLDELRIKLDELRNRYKPGHPDLTKAEREVAELERSINAQPRTGKREPTATYLRYVTLQSELDGIEQRIKGYRREQQTITSQIGSYQGRVEAAPRHERALDSMTREMTVGESQLHALLDKQLDTKLAEGLQNSESGVAFAIVEPASVPKEPFSPQRERLVLLGIFAGLGLGVVVAFFLEQSDTSFANIDDFQAFTTLPVIGAIPNINGKGNENAGTSRKQVMTVFAPDSVPAEQYRILAMKVYQQCKQTGSRVVLLTSAAGNEGKSLTAMNLGAALTSLVDGPVLLVDADMRKPRLHDYLEMTIPQEKGFHSLLLKSEDDFNDYVVKMNDLSVIPGSPTNHGNPVAALASPKVRALFDRLRDQYKLILVDAPPTLPIADSHILSGLCDKVMFVVRARKTPRELFQHAVESYDASSLIGSVLNDVDYQRSRYAYAYEYYRENYVARK